MQLFIIPMMIWIRDALNDKMTLESVGNSFVFKIVTLSNLRGFSTLFGRLLRNINRCMKAMHWNELRISFAWPVFGRCEVIWFKTNILVIETEF